jgi:hypothetical protein
MEADKHGRTPGAQNDLICALRADSHMVALTNSAG